MEAKVTLEVQPNMAILVTGSNKGIGFSILERLIKEHTHDNQKVLLVMTSRDMEQGNLSKAKLDELIETLPESSRPILHLLQLDLTKQTSIDHFVSQCPPLTVLINNAGIMYPGRHVNDTIITNTLQTNYLGTRTLTNSLLTAGKILPRGRIVFVSSKIGDPRRVTSKHTGVSPLLNKFLVKPQKEVFSAADLEEITQRYASEVKDPKLQGLWPNSVYAVSKLFITLFAHVLSQDPSVLSQHISVFACCPGWCQTDLTKGSKAPLTAFEGASTPVFLATAPGTALESGQFYFEQKPHNF